MQALTKLNAPKVHAEWRQRMRDAKLAELKGEALRMQEQHTHAMHVRNLALQVSLGSLPDHAGRSCAALSNHDSLHCTLRFEGFRGDVSAWNKLRRIHLRTREQILLLQLAACSVQALDAELQEAEAQQIEAHEAHLKTVTGLIEKQEVRLDATLHRYEDIRTVRPPCPHVSTAPKSPSCIHGTATLSRCE